MEDRKQNAPANVFEFMNEHPYAGYEEHTYDWKIQEDDGDFVLYECFDGPSWTHMYCACYKGRAYAYGKAYWTIRDIHDTAKSFHEFMGKLK